MPALDKPVSGRGSARLERCVRVAEVPGSNPGAPTGEQLGGITAALFLSLKLTGFKQPAGNQLIFYGLLKAVLHAAGFLPP